MLEMLEAKLAESDTPAARRREVISALLDGIVLTCGIAGIVAFFPPLIYVGAGGHLLASFIGAPIKSLWIGTSLVSAVVCAALTCAAVYLSIRYWHGYDTSAALTHVKTNLLELGATAIVAGGLVGVLMSQPGLMDQVRQ